MTDKNAAVESHARFKRNFILLSPLLLTASNYVTARLSAHFLGRWAWVPLQIEYWAMLTAILAFCGGWTVLRQGYRRPTHWGWWIPCLLVGLTPLPVLLLNRGLMREPLLIASWLAIALVNPFFEETYWRGLFGEVTQSWPALLACVYPTLFFAFGHPLGLGVFSIGCRSRDMLVALIVMGLVWSYTYRRTRSLQAITFSHMLVDFFNMSVWVYMNILIPKSSL